MSLALNEIELRVLGVLMEKAMTTPNAYPLSINAIVLGANQVQNRAPIMSLTDGDVSRALQTLGHKGLAAQAPPVPGARANRYQHTVVDGLHWDRREQAIMVELMLRGPQTAGELRTRSSRMCPIADVPGALHVLAELAQHEPPFVEELPREPGRSTNRFRHLLEPGGTPVDDADHGLAATDVGAPDGAEEPPAGPHAGVGLQNRMDSLEARVANLEARLAEIEKKNESDQPGSARFDIMGGE